MIRSRPFCYRKFVVQLTVTTCVLTLVCKTSAAPDDSATSESDSQPPAEKLSDTWSKTLPVSDPPDAKYGEWRFWVQDGWLLAERRTRNDEIEWKIVLAKVVGDELPKIVVNRIPAGARMVHRASKGGETVTTVAPEPTGPIPGSLRLSYRDGRYFIRDEFGSLRCLREPKTEDQPWPELELPPRDANPRSGSGGAGGGPGSSWLASQVSNSWVIIAAGPYADPRNRAADCLVRVSHQDLRPPGGAPFRGRQGVARFSYGDWFVIDDAEFLVAERLDASHLPFELQRLAQRDPVLAVKLAMQKLGGSPAPELSGEVWLNAEKPTTWKDLRGKPVLLVLFDLKQPSFVPLVPPLLGFQEMFAKQGLAVIGVHAKAPRDELEKRLGEEHIDFPVLIDDGQTAERYGVGFSACLLIDRDGKVVSVYKDSLAPPAEIEKLLEEAGKL